MTAHMPVPRSRVMRTQRHEATRGFSPYELIFEFEGKRVELSLILLFSLQNMHERGNKTMDNYKYVVPVMESRGTAKAEAWWLQNRPKPQKSKTRSSVKELRARLMDWCWFPVCLFHSNIRARLN
jgi:hypothetical protein